MPKTYFKPHITSANKKDISSYVYQRYACIYEIRCVFNNRTYIGQTQDLNLRWNQHISGCLAPINFGHLTNIRLAQDVKEHGIENFTFRILKKCFGLTNEEREALERKFIDELKPYYNIDK